MSGVTEHWDEELEREVSEQYEEACSAYRSQIDECMRAQRGEKSREWWDMYHRYLRSSVWQVKRQLVLDRCGGFCESCGQYDAEHVHHLKYPETFGLEPLWDLRAVCKPCHKIIHPHME
jgi:5-methylcytosine-specific restriction endonuclease McrA